MRRSFAPGPGARGPGGRAGQGPGGGPPQRRQAPRLLGEPQARTEARGRLTPLHRAGPRTPGPRELPAASRRLPAALSPAAPGAPHPSSASRALGPPRGCRRTASRAPGRRSSAHSGGQARTRQPQPRDALGPAAPRPSLAPDRGAGCGVRGEDAASGRLRAAPRPLSPPRAREPHRPRRARLRGKGRAEGERGPPEPTLRPAAAAAADRPLPGQRGKSRRAERRSRLTSCTGRAPDSKHSPRDGGRGPDTPGRRGSCPKRKQPSH